MCILLALPLLHCIGRGGLDFAGSDTIGKSSRQSVEINPESGGVLEAGNFRLSVPPGALDTPTTISAEIQSIPATADIRALSNAVRFSPEGLQFMVPAELRICYPPTAEVPDNSMQVYYQTDSNDLIAIAGSTNTQTHCVSAPIEHFSSYVAGARATLPGNTPPSIGGANFLPANPLASIPLRIRTQINDLAGAGAPGQVASAFLYYRIPGAPTYQKVALQPDTTDATVTNRYYYLIPQQEVTLAGIEYYFEATDNHNVKRTTAVTTRSITATAAGIRLTPVNPLVIASGFSRVFALQATADISVGPWQNISAENVSLADAAIGSLVRTGPYNVRFVAGNAGTTSLQAQAGAFSASTGITVVPGLLQRIALTDTNQIEITGTRHVAAGSQIDIDAVGYDAFGNVAKILPLFSTTNGIGTVTVDLTGAHFTAAVSPASGQIVANLAAFSASANVVVYAAPYVTSTLPAEGAMNVPQTSLITIYFSQPMDAATLTANTGTACTGSIQVSRDNFVTCEPMTSAAPTAEPGNTAFTWHPTGLLFGRAQYRIRVSAAARDITGYALWPAYLSLTGFTVEPDLHPPTIIQTIPATASTAVPYNAPLSVIFDRQMAASGLIEANFVLLCAAKSVPYLMDLADNNTRVILQPQVFLPANASCTLTVTTGVSSSENVAMAADYILQFTTGYSPTASLVREVDIQQPANSSMFTVFNNKAFFVAHLNSFGRELWLTDGTFSGTAQVRDIWQGLSSSSPDQIVAGPQGILFVAENGVHGRELWKSDGTQAGTVMVKDIRPGPAPSNIGKIVFCNGIAYFSADDGVHGQELWRSDGSATGTYLVKDIYLNSAASNPGPAAVFNGILYFAATDGSSGYELWRSDGTESGTMQVADIRPGSDSSYPKGFTVHEESLFFTAYTDNSGEELWLTTGSAASTVLVSDLIPGSASSYPEILGSVGNHLYFAADDGIHGKELWHWQNNATSLVHDLVIGIGGSVFESFLNIPDKGIYLTNAAAGTHSVWFLPENNSSPLKLAESAAPVATPTAYLGRIYFSNSAAETGVELWSTNGNVASSQIAQDIKLGAVSSNPTGLIRLGNQLLFRISDPFSAYPTGLWVYK